MTDQQQETSSTMIFIKSEHEVPIASHAMEDQLDDFSKTSSPEQEKTSTGKTKTKRKKPVKKDEDADDEHVKKNQPVVVEVDGTCSKNRTIIEGFNDHKYPIGKLISFKKCNVNGHPTIYTNRPIHIHGTIGAMIVNERSSRRIGQDRIQVYGVEIGKNRYAWVAQSVLESLENEEKKKPSNSPMSTSPHNTMDLSNQQDMNISNESLSESVQKLFSLPLNNEFPSVNSNITVDNSAKKRKREDKKAKNQLLIPNQTPKTPFSTPPMASYPFFPPYPMFNNKPMSQFTQIISKLQLVTVSPNRAHSKKPQHFVLNVVLSGESEFTKPAMISQLLSPFSPPIGISFIDKTNPNNSYTIYKKHILTPLQDNCPDHDFEIFAYTPIINESHLECHVKLIVGSQEILSNNQSGLDFEFYEDTSDGSTSVVLSAIDNMFDSMEFQDLLVEEGEGLNHNSTTPSTDIDAFNLFEQFELSPLSKSEKFLSFRGKRDSSGHNLLHHFAARGMLNEVYELLKLGYNPLERDCLGNTVYDICESFNLTEVEEILDYFLSEQSIPHVALSPQNLCVNTDSPTTIEDAMVFSEYLDMIEEGEQFTCDNSNNILFQILKCFKKMDGNSLILNPDVNIFISKSNSRVSIENTDYETPNVDYFRKLHTRYWSPELLFLICMKSSISERRMIELVRTQNLWTISVLFTELLYLSREKKERNSIFGMTTNPHLLGSYHFDVLGNPSKLRNLLDDLSRMTDFTETRGIIYTLSSVSTLNDKEKDRILFEANERSLSMNNGSRIQGNNLATTMSESCIELLDLMLKWIPEERLDIFNLIEHPYWVESEINKRNAREDLMRQRMFSQVPSLHHTNEYSKFCDVVISTTPSFH